MRRSQRKPSVRKKATRRQARGGGYGAGPQSGGRIPRPAFFTSVPGIVLLVVVAALVVVLFIVSKAKARVKLEAEREFTAKKLELEQRMAFMNAQIASDREN